VRKGLPAPSITARLLVVAFVLTTACGGDGEDGERSAPEDTTTQAAARQSAGCEAAEGPPAVEEERTLTVDGTTRRYLITVPSAHDGEAPLPVVFDIHGLMEGAEIHTRMSQYSALAEEEGFVVVFPHGAGQPVQWDVDADAATNDDIAYFDAVLDEVGSVLCIDESRVYATGLSNGAMFVSALLCTRADVLAAAAPVAGLLNPDPCEPARPVPVLAFHGTADPILLFNGGVDTSSFTGPPESGPTTTQPPADLEGEGYPANVAAWAERNGCDPEPSDTEVSDEVIHRVYDCPDGADVEFYIVVGGGHAWPSSEFSQSIESVVGHTTFEIDATRDGWEFMSRFTSP